jgi:RNA polymerase sigma-70 factor, ECF subfamily
LADHLFRHHAGRMVAWLTRLFGPAHLELAEEVVQDALVKALQQWPRTGVPENPAGWLYHVARNGAFDALRRTAAFRAREPALALELARVGPGAEPGAAAIADDELRMMFMCCHPALSRDGRVALSLKIVGGFSVHEIARAFLVEPGAIAQRLVRAKRQVRDLRLDLELPRGADLAVRLDSVLETIYLLFNEGYSAHEGADLIRADLCREGLRLARLVADAPDSSAPRAHALASLIAFQAARLDARVDEGGELVLLEDQDRSRWDSHLVALGFHHLERSAEGPAVNAYHVEAAIASLHARTVGGGTTPWPEILDLYDELLALNPSPIVALNRVVALSKARGAAAGLEVLSQLARDPALTPYYLLYAVEARLLAE